MTGRSCGFASPARSTARSAVRLGWLLAALVLAHLVAGCASLGSGKAGNADKAAAPAAAASAPDHAEYRLEVVAPDALKPLLSNYLDLARFQNAPATEGITAAELDRLILAAPAQVRSLLETEGYFSPVVKVGRVGAAPRRAGPLAPLSALPGLIGLPTPKPAETNEAPLLRVEVEPGPRVTVSEVALDVSGALETAVAAGEAARVKQLGELRRLWPLQPGEPFRQSAWSDAKASTLARLRGDGYPAATWGSTAAQIDAQAQTAKLTLVLDSGPLFRLGKIQIEGLQRYDENSVVQLSTFSAGMPYTDKLLLDFQERLQKVGLFEGAFVEIDPNPDTAAAAPVLVRVKEQPLQTATFGLGYSAVTGPRATVEHTYRSVFGSRWSAKNAITFGSTQKLWQLDLTSHPLQGLYRNLVAGSYERLLANDELRTSWSARAGRTQDTSRIERTYYLEFVKARLETAAGLSDDEALSINYNWVYRDVDSVVLPTKGETTSAQVAFGEARSVTADNGPFGRFTIRSTGYLPLPGSFFATARGEFAQVFAGRTVGIPDTLLFRAGGDDSVRGYAYRSLGPLVNGVVTSGRKLLTLSVEVARPISASKPQFWWATFVDAGNAVDEWGGLHLATGYGVGLRWRSPVGPLRLDLAYGQDVRAYRVHLSVGIAF